MASKRYGVGGQLPEALAQAVAGIAPLLEHGDQPGSTHLARSADIPDVGELEDGRPQVAVDGHDPVAPLHAGHVVGRAREAQGQVELGRDGLARLADESLLGQAAVVDHRPRGPHRALEQVGQFGDRGQSSSLALPDARPPRCARRRPGRRSGRPAGDGRELTVARARGARVRRCAGHLGPPPSERRPTAHSGPRPARGGRASPPGTRRREARPPAPAGRRRPARTKTQGPSSSHSHGHCIRRTQASRRCPSVRPAEVRVRGRQVGVGPACTAARLASAPRPGRRRRRSRTAPSAGLAGRPGDDIGAARPASRPASPSASRAAARLPGLAGRALRRGVDAPRGAGDARRPARRHQRGRPARRTMSAAGLTPASRP